MAADNAPLGGAKRQPKPSAMVQEDELIDMIKKNKKARMKPVDLR
jgi:hypothetical protein